MRIECEVCSATYTIDDAQLSDQPIGAQCPYCGHVKLVRKGGDVPAAAPPAFPPVGSPPGPPPGGSPSYSQPPPPDLGFGGHPPPSAPLSSQGVSAGAFAPDPHQAAGDLQLDSGYGAPPPGFPSSNVPTEAPGPASSLELPFSANHNPPVEEQGPGFEDPRAYEAPTAVASAGAPAPEAAGDDVCRVCGTALLDEFDKVIGLCETHQREQRAGDLDDGVLEFTAEANDSGWFARTPDGSQLGPLNLEEIRTKIRDGQLALTDLYSQDGVNFGPISQFRELSYLTSLQVGGEAGVAPRTSYAKPKASFDGGRLVTPVLAVAVVAGLGILGFTQKDTLVQLYQNIVAKPVDTGPLRPNPLKRYLASWRLAHPDVSGSASEHLQSAHSFHLEDSWTGYEKAEKAYQRALLLDENEPKAIAGFIENLALWRYELASLEERKMLDSALAYVLELAPKSGQVHRAKAALALAKGDLNGCREGADEAEVLKPGDPQARLLLAGCFMEGNIQLSVSKAERALQRLPELHRAERVLVEAYSRQGRFSTALKKAQERVQARPKDSASYVALGRAHAAVAQYTEAMAAYKAAANLDGDQQQARLAWALLLQEQGYHALAVQQFSKAAEAQIPIGKRAVQIYGGWARSELARKRTERAEKLADQALKHSHKKDVSALLVKAEASFLAGSATTAASFVARAQKESKDDPVVMMVSGMVTISQGAQAAGLKQMRIALDNKPKDPRILAVLASQHLAAGKSAQAYALMRKTTEMDPLAARRVEDLGYSTVSDWLVRDAIRHFTASGRKPRNASIASSSIGLLYYHLGETERAKTAVRRALSLDDANVMALILQSQMALDRRDAAGALKAANRLLLAERGSAIGFLLKGRALFLQKKYPEARRNYESALRSAPGLIPAQVDLALLAMAEGDSTQAVEKLKTAYRVNPGSLTIRQALLKSEI